MNEFSLDDFKRWMKQQTEFSVDMPRASYVGFDVVAGIPKKKLGSRMCVREGSLEELIDDFAKRGGKVVDIDGKHLVIETNCGSFSIPTYCIQKR